MGAVDGGRSMGRFLPVGSHHLDRRYLEPRSRPIGSVLKPGGNFGGANQTNPSYFAPSYYRVFAKVTPGHNWMAVVDSSYTILGQSLWSPWTGAELDQFSRRRHQWPQQ